MKQSYVIGDSVMIEESDGTWSVACNGSNDLENGSLKSAIEIILENEITQEDCEAWHSGDGYSDHLKYLAMEIPVNDLVFQIWGSPDGQEPLSVVVESFTAL